MCSLKLKQVKDSLNVNANVNIFDDVNVSVGEAFFFLYLSIDLPTSTWEDVQSPSSGECRSK